MKMMLSTPSTISSALSIAKAIQTFGSISSSMPASSCRKPQYYMNANLAEHVRLKPGQRAGTSHTKASATWIAEPSGG
ncbi:hypothetical protein GCM10027317_13890 [Massilia agri]